MVAVNEAVSAKVRAAFGFSVERLPLRGPDNMPTPFYGLFRSDTMECVGSAVTAAYHPHQVEDVLALVDAAASVFSGVADVRCYFKEGHHVTILPSKQERLDVFGTADNVLPRFRISAGYDGNALMAGMWFFRDACKNMSRMRTVTSSVGVIRHTRGIRERMDELITNFQLLARSWDATRETIMAMESKRVSIKDLIHAVFPVDAEATERRLRAAVERENAIVARLKDERARTRPGTGWNDMVTGWEAYNGIQGYIQHDARRRGNPNVWERQLAADRAPEVEVAERLILAA